MELKEEKTIYNALLAVISKTNLYTHIRWYREGKKLIINGNFVTKYILGSISNDICLIIRDILNKVYKVDNNDWPDDIKRQFKDVRTWINTKIAHPLNEYRSKANRGMLRNHRKPFDLDDMFIGRVVYRLICQEEIYEIYKKNSKAKIRFPFALFKRDEVETKNNDIGHLKLIKLYDSKESYLDAFILINDKPYYNDSEKWIIEDLDKLIKK